MPVRILSFSPYAGWRVHSNFETAIHRACQVRGAETRTILCDGPFAECDYHDRVGLNAPRPLDLCARCKAESASVLGDHGRPFEWLGAYLTPADRSRVLAWAQSLRPDELQSASFDGLPVGDAVLSSVANHFRAFPVAMDDWETLTAYRGFVQAGALATIALNRAFDTHAPDALLLFNGRLSLPRIAFSVARQRGIRVLVHESPRSPGTICLVENALATSPVPYREFIRAWRDIPLTGSQVATAARWISDRRRHAGAHATFLRFASIPEGTASVRARLAISDARPLALLLTSSGDEFAGNPDIAFPFESQEDWIRRCAEWAARRKDLLLVIRAHPCLAGKGVGARSASAIAWFAELARHVADNVRVVQPDDPVSSYDLMDEARFGLSWGSTAGLEMFALGKPLGLVPGMAIYEHTPGMVRFEQPDELEHQLDVLATMPPSREHRRHAFRTIHRYLYDAMVPFPAVRMTGPFTSELTDLPRSSLLPGGDPGLDRICRFLLENEPILRPPAEQHASRSQAEEDAALDALQRDGAWPNESAEMSTRRVRGRDLLIELGVAAIKKSLRTARPHALRLLEPVARWSR